MQDKQEKLFKDYVKEWTFDKPTYEVEENGKTVLKKGRKYWDKSDLEAIAHKLNTEHNFYKLNATEKMAALQSTLERLKPNLQSLDETEQVQLKNEFYSYFYKNLSEMNKLFECL